MQAMSFPPFSLLLPKCSSTSQLEVTGLGIFGIEGTKKELLQPLTGTNTFYPKLINNLTLSVLSLKALRLKDIYYKQML